MFRGNSARTGFYNQAELANFGGIQWYFKTGGAVRSSPTIAGGLAVIGGSDGFLYAFDANSAEERWKFDAGSPIVSTPGLAA
jgi:outer membrane protein assembly factor BamB